MNSHNFFSGLWERGIIIIFSHKLEDVLFCYTYLFLALFKIFLWLVKASEQIMFKKRLYIGVAV